MKLLGFDDLIARLRAVAGALPDPRTSDNRDYSMSDIALAAFSVFLTQCPSFLSFQRNMEQSRARNNARSLFQVQDIPTDPESQIMKAGGGPHFEQSYNAQAVVEVESRLIVGQCVNQSPNDKQELVPTLSSIPAEAGPVAAALVDSGFFSEKAATQIERAADGTPTGTTVYEAMEETGHHRTVPALEKKLEPEPLAADASVTEEVRHRLQTTAGKMLYKLQKQTVKLVFGILKSVLGFRQFRLRRRAKASLEWTLACLAYNLKRLHRLGTGLQLAVRN